MTEHEHDPSEHDPDEHDPVESARPSIGRRDAPDAIQPHTDGPDTPDRPHRKLPPDPEEEDTAGDDAPDAPRPSESPAGRD
jgi:hypothetical protein